MIYRKLNYIYIYIYIYTHTHTHTHTQTQTHSLHITYYILQITHCYSKNGKRSEEKSMVHKEKRMK
jgi:hypothetical protein